MIPCTPKPVRRASVLSCPISVHTFNSSVCHAGRSFLRGASVTGLLLAAGTGAAQTSTPEAVAPVVEPASGAASTDAAVAPVVVPASAPAPVEPARAPAAVSPSPAAAPAEAPAPLPTRRAGSPLPAPSKGPVGPAPVSQAVEAVKASPAARVVLPWPELKVTPGGFLQLWMVPFDMNDPDMNDPVVAGDPDLDEGFAIRRARLSLRADLTPSMAFNLEAGYGAEATGVTKSDEYPTLQQANVEFHREKMPEVVLGVTRVPFGGQASHTSRSMLLAERSVTALELGYDYDAGLTLHGHVEGTKTDAFGFRGLAWYLGLFNGSGSFFRDDNGLGDRPDAPGSFANPLGLLQVLRATGTMGTAEAPKESNIGRTAKEISMTLGLSVAGNRMLEARSLALGADLGIYAGPISLNLEATWKTTSPQYSDEGIPEVYDDIAAFGFFAQSGVFVVPNRIQLAARVELYDGNKDVSDADDLLLVSGGFNYYPYRSDALKIQTNYIRRVERSSAISIQNDTLLVGVSTYF